MRFTYVDINVGNVWKQSTNTAVIPAGAAGIYYVHVQASSQSIKGFVVDLKVNNVVVFSVNHKIANNWAGQVREKASIMRLEENDALTVSVNCGDCGYYGGDKKATAFNGFRLA